MATDDERREVARRLRDSAEERMAVKGRGNGNSWSWLYRSIFGHYMGTENGAKGCYVEVAHRLADLIEPPTQCPYYHSGRHYCSAYDDVVDRHALLKLADRIQHHADNSAGHSAYAARFDLAGWAEVIREACGSVQED